SALRRLRPFDAWGQILRAQRWIDRREFEQADQCKRRTPSLRGCNRQEFAHWPSVHRRQEFVHPARRWWPTREKLWGERRGLASSSLDESDGGSPCPKLMI